MDVTKKGIIAFKGQMAAEVDADAQRLAQTAPPGAAAGAAPQASLVSAISGAVDHAVVTAPGKSNEQKLMNMQAIAKQHTAGGAVSGDDNKMQE